MMKKLNMKIWAGAMAIILLTSSCNDFLDINENPNQPLESTPPLSLASAIVSTANISNQFNSMGAHFGGYMANAGGFSGFGTLFTYNLTASDYNGLWVNTYQDPLMDLKQVIDKTEGVVEMGYFNGAAKIMTAYNYQKLVDAFGDVPYTTALQGETGNLTPEYDKANEIYPKLIALLDEAVETIRVTQERVAYSGGALSCQFGNAAVFATNLTKASDPLWGPLAESTAVRPIGDIMQDWKRFAKTLKLKMLVRMNAAPADFNDPDFNTATVVMLKKKKCADGDSTVANPFRAGIGFITDDALVDPGYEQNRPNPAWASWGRNIAGTALSNSSRVPTKFAYGFYASQYTNGETLGPVATLPAKINDAGRGATIYVNFAVAPGATTTPTNQLGNEVGNRTIVSGAVTWAGTAVTGLGVLKGPGQSQPLMLLAESKFLIAEALLEGQITTIPALGTYTSNFNEGVLASFTYLYKNASETVVTTFNTPSAPAGTTSMAAKVAYYQGAENPTNYLANIALASTDAQRLEAIITQKYIAVNMLNSDEGYNEFRRTGFPKTAKNGAPHMDIASNKSTITETTSTLPTRIMYPASEASYNAANYKNINYRGVDRIFWDTNGVD